MAEKNLKARIVHKHDVEANWLLAIGFTPKQGEIIVYDIDNTHSYERFKIGDGIQNVNALPFAGDALKAELEAEISEVSALVGDTSVSEQINTALNENSDFIINIDSNRMADKTWQEAFEAKESGRRLYCVYNNRLYHYSFVGYDYYRFICIDADVIHSIDFYDWTQEVFVLETRFINKDEIKEEIALALVMEMGLITPIATQNNKIITDSQGRIYLL